MRARALPPAARRALGLRGSERVLAWAKVDTGPEAGSAGAGPDGAAGGGAEGAAGDPGEGAAGVWVATTSGLRAGVVQELPWEAIAEMSWDAPQLRIRPLRGEEIVGRLRDGGDLAAQVRARLETSIVHSRRVPLLADGRGVLVVARRVGPERRVTWAVVFDPGVDPDDPVHRERAMAFLAQVRAQVGL
jgi:hypothetical protein